MEKERVDVLLVKQGLFDSREQAKRAVMAGEVLGQNNERLDKAGEDESDVGRCQTVPSTNIVSLSQSQNTENVCTHIIIIGIVAPYRGRESMKVVTMQKVKITLKAPMRITISTGS